MKVHKSIILLVPDRYVQDLNAFLKANKLVALEPDYFYYVAYHILVNQVMQRNKIGDDLTGFVSINMKHLKSLTTYKIGDYIKLLIKGDFIKCDDMYRRGEKSRGFIINDRYLSGVQRIEIRSTCKLFHRIINSKNAANSHNNRLPEFLKQMRIEFMELDLDYSKAEKWILSEPDEVKRISYEISLQQLKDKRFRYFKRNKTNFRLDSNLTNLKSDFRQFIIGDYVSIDLKNSQPFFLNQLLKSIINNTAIHESTLCCKILNIDLVKTFGIKRLKRVLLIRQKPNKSKMANLKSYEYSVNNGSLYDDFLNSFGGDITRSKVKEIMFKVMFSKNQNYAGFKQIVPFEKDKKIFAEVFPFVYDCIKFLKDRDHKILPVTLQRIESYIFIDCIAKKLTETGIVPFTIHDSVIVKSADQGKAMKIIEDVFQQHYSVTPAFEIKKLRNE